MKFLWDGPALLVDRTLVVTDLHVGIEYEYWKSGIKIPSQTKNMRTRIDALLKKTKATTLLICGDFKHKVPGITYQEEREIPGFLEHFAKSVAVEIAPGNHDADLHRLTPEGVVIHPATGILKGKTFFFHGHTWPGPGFTEAETLVMGHLQPQLEIRDKLGYVWREQVWVTAPLNKATVKEKYQHRGAVPDAIVVPSFNPMAGGLALNKPRKGKDSPLTKLLKLPKAEIHLLDGTFLGELSTL